MRNPFNGSFPITQNFGERPEYYKKYNINGHNGIDYGTPHRTPIFAPHSGQIIEATFDAGYGNYIKIENDIEGSVLAHLDEIIVRIGFSVTEGELLGYSDNTGDSSGPHLHWGYYRIPRNRQNGYNGYVDQAPYVTSSKNTMYKYKINDIVEPAVNIPVGKAPGLETTDYGRIGPDFPGKIIGISDGYYNIDQTAIGGGTGWARADVVDQTNQYMKPLPPSVAPSEPIISEELQEQITNLRVERDKAIQTAQEQQIEITRLTTILSGFKALGYETADDVTKVIQTYDNTITGCKTELIQVLNRNKDLAKLLQEKENEDATAIEEGMKGIAEAKELESKLREIAKTTGSSTKLFDIIDSIKTIKVHADRFLKTVKEKKEKKRPITTETKQNGIDWLLKILFRKR